MSKNNSTILSSYENQARLYKVLMHPARLAILDVLRYGEQCVCHMEAALGYRQAYISQQLMILRDAGVIDDRRDGWNIYYCVIQSEIYTVIDTVLMLTDETGQTKPNYPANTPIPNCPCPKCNPDKEPPSENGSQHSCSPRRRSPQEHLENQG